MSTADTTAEVGAGSRQLSCTREASEKAMAPTPVLLPGKSHGWRSLVGCSPWGHEESDMTERLHFHALEKEIATHSSILAWRIPGTGELHGLQSKGLVRVGHDQVTSYFHFPLSCIGEGNGNPLRRSCLENPRDGGAWWAAVYGVAQSQTQLKQLSSSSSSSHVIKTKRIVRTTSLAKQ